MPCRNYFAFGRDDIVRRINKGTPIRRFSSSATFPSYFQIRPRHFARPTVKYFRILDTAHATTSASRFRSNDSDATVCFTANNSRIDVRSRATTSPCVTVTVWPIRTIRVYSQHFESENRPDRKLLVAKSNKLNKRHPAAGKCDERSRTTTTENHVPIKLVVRRVSPGVRYRTGHDCRRRLIVNVRSSRRASRPSSFYGFRKLRTKLSRKRFGFVVINSFVNT